MTSTVTLSEAKAKLSELIGRVHFGRERLTITRKGKAVALLSPVGEEDTEGASEGLIRAKGALADADAALDEMIEAIYRQRDRATGREVPL